MSLIGGLLAIAVVLTLTAIGYRFSMKDALNMYPRRDARPTNDNAPDDP
jgi:hypothetical protein